MSHTVSLMLQFKGLERTKQKNWNMKYFFELDIFIIWKESEFAFNVSSLTLLTVSKWHLIWWAVVECERSIYVFKTMQLFSYVIIYVTFGQTM